MSNHFIILEILLMFIIFVTSDIVYKSINMECLPNPVYIENATCRLKALSRYKAGSNMECDIVKPLRNVSVHFQLFWKNDANFYRPFLVNVTVNICDIFDKRNFATYGLILKNVLMDSSNANHSCPYTGHLTTKNLYLNEKFLPLTPPLGLYKFVLHFLEGYPYEDIGTVILYIQFIEKRDLRPRAKRAQANI